MNEFEISKAIEEMDISTVTRIIGPVKLQLEELSNLLKIDLNSSDGLKEILHFVINLNSLSEIGKRTPYDKKIHRIANNLTPENLRNIESTVYLSTQIMGCLTAQELSYRHTDQSANTNAKKLLSLVTGWEKDEELASSINTSMKWRENTNLKDIPLS